MSKVVKDEKNEVSGSKFVNPLSNYRYSLDGDFYEDLSDPFVEVFEEVPAYALDPNTGKFLNETSQPKIISKGKINVQEKIDSFGREVDIYSILEKFAYGDDSSLLNARPCQYGDISSLPNDLNGYAEFVNAHYKNLFNMNPELAKKVLDESIPAESIENEANKLYQLRLEDFNKENDKKVEVKE